MADLVADHPNPLGGLSPQRHLNRLLDRATFFEHLRRAIARNEGVGGNLALLAMAMDPFVVSDVDASDAWGIREEILTVTAGRFLGCLHHTFVTARIAGDEFLVLTEGIRGIGGAVEIAEQILMAVRGPEPSVFEQKMVSASVGIAFLEHGMGAEHLLINADIALYSARSSGGNRPQVFQEWMRETELTHPSVA